MKSLKRILDLFVRDRGEGSASNFHDSTVRRICWREFFGVFIFMALAILVVTWPWVCHLSNEFIVHWDPPFHTWKLEYVAKSILSGHLLPEGGNTNMHYPNSGALFYEALHWPQAVLAAGMFCFTDNPVIVYHLVLIFFWALSGVCMWMLLLELGTTRLAAIAGAFFFVINPYRVSYMIEFNMELCFGLPLFFFFTVRFFKKPSIGYACGMALALWLQAASELYQAVFIIMVFPFLFIGMISWNWKLMTSWRRFWLPVSVAALILGVLTYLLLWPYSVLHAEQVVERGLREISKHSLEPLAFFSSSMRYALIRVRAVKFDEMCVYPTAIVLFLSACFLALSGIQRLKEDPPFVKCLRLVRIALLVFYFVMSIVFHLVRVTTSFSHLYSYTPVFVVALSIMILLLARNKPVAGKFYDALFACSLFAFFMTFGPNVFFVNTRVRISNVLYLELYNWMSALNGFRVVSRFSIIILVFMTLSSALFLDRLQKFPFFRKRKFFLGLLYLFSGLMVMLASLPEKLEFHQAKIPLSTPVIEFLDDLQEPYVLAMVPMGDRNIDGMHMVQIARNTKTFVYAWGGNFPATSILYQKVLRPVPGSPKVSLPVLSELWPECLILIDKPAVALVAKDYDIVQDYSVEAEKLLEDERFALFRIRKDSISAREKIKIVRQDFILKRPQLNFSVYGEKATTVTLFLNDTRVDQFLLAAGDSSSCVVIASNLTKQIIPNTFKFVGNDEFILTDFRLESEK